MNEYKNVGVVAIGRNEGSRLRKCLESVNGQVKQIVYVDSGSTDESLSIARDLGVEIVELDINIPFTAARARNTGFGRLIELQPHLEYILFVDGDCEVVVDWIEKAITYIEEKPEIGVICGRRKERYPEHSIYNMMCDIEWNTPTGEAKACGGDAIYRIQAFNEAGGFREALIAGEEPELCVRIRQGGWKIWRLDALMTLHDADMLRFEQWWKRAVRSGYAYAEGTYLHGKPPEKHWVQETKRIWVWGGFIPLLILVLILVNSWWTLLLAVYPLQVFRLARKGKQPSVRDNWVYATFLVIGKFPELFGQFKFIHNLFRGQRGVLIEYK